MEKRQLHTRLTSLLHGVSISGSLITFLLLIFEISPRVTLAIPPVGHMRAMGRGYLNTY